MKIHLEADGFALTPELDKYASKKAKFAVRKLRAGDRAGADCAIRFAEANGVTTCSIVLKVRSEAFMAEEATQHPYAALDIVAAHLERQLADFVSRYGSKHDWQVP